jgi:hypothetical protein
MAKTTVHKRSSKSKATSPCRTPSKSTRTPKKARLVQSASKRRDPDAHDDYTETHVVTNGTYKGFHVTPKREGSNAFTLIKNGRGKPLYQQREVELNKDDVEELDHLDMLKISSEDVAAGEDEEDEALVKFEMTTWTCLKCKAINQNDESICKTEIGENKMCRGTPAAKANLTWAGCFSSVSFMVSLQVDCGVHINVSLHLSNHKLILHFRRVVIRGLAVHAACKTISKKAFVKPAKRPVQSNHAVIIGCSSFAL